MHIYIYIYIDIDIGVTPLGQRERFGMRSLPRLLIQELITPGPPMRCTDARPYQLCTNSPDEKYHGMIVEQPR